VWSWHRGSGVRSKSQLLITIMLHKRAIPHEPDEVQPKRRLRQNLADLFLGNNVSGQRAQTLFSDATLSGAGHCDDLGKAGSSGKHPKNASRDIRSKLLKRSGWPPLYFADIAVSDNEGNQKTANVAMLLPHELLHVMFQFAKPDALYKTQGLAEESLVLLEECKANIGSQEVAPLGMWIDGVPCNWDRSESLEVVSLHLPGLDDDMSNMRIPLCTILKTHCFQKQTMDDILAICSWSLKCAILGIMPSERHDGTKFGPSDCRRRRWQGDSTIRSVLVEIRGDWAMFKQVFRLPGWQEKGGICWRCTATLESMRQTSLHAEWRNERLGHFGLLHRILSAGGTPSPLFSAPFLSNRCFRVDWLHTTDLGVGADFMGNLLFMLLPRCEGNSKQQQVQSLFRKMKAYYREEKVSSPYQHMTALMIKQEGKCPKLRGKAAEVRGIMKFCLQQAEQMCDEADPTDETVLHAARHLHACYAHLSAGQFDAEHLKLHSRKFCSLYVALSDMHGPDLWRFKPKFHQFQEMCEYASNLPSSCWCYRDEDFGGSMAQYARRRGGHKTPFAVSRQVLSLFIAKHTVPRVS
jgi:hypothetical protein